ncbi:MAG: hypothetical protein AAGD01_15135 [Acidobacteriota bacterium]
MSRGPEDKEPPGSEGFDPEDTLKKIRDDYRGVLQRANPDRTITKTMGLTAFIALLILTTPYAATSLGIPADDVVRIVEALNPAKGSILVTGVTAILAFLLGSRFQRN